MSEIIKWPAVGRPANELCLTCGGDNIIVLSTGWCLCSHCYGVRNSLGKDAWPVWPAYDPEVHELE